MQQSHSAVSYTFSSFCCGNHLPISNLRIPHLLHLVVESFLLFILSFFNEIHFAQITYQSGIISFYLIEIKQSMHHGFQCIFILFPRFLFGWHILWELNIVTLLHRVELLGMENKIHTKLFCTQQRKPQE